MLITVYFGYHGIYGNHGLLRLKQLNHEIYEAQQNLTSLESEVSALKTKVEAIKLGSRDLIEEELLRVLNMGNTSDLVILTDENAD
jgi:cell division protein FtsB